MPLAASGGMLNMLTAPALTCVFLGVVIGLGAALVWAFWEIEQVSKSQRSGKRFG
jgi:predicted negative regulator of RcsB-dependent stress response